MRLALQTDFALRLLIYLAGRPQRTTAAQVAEFYCVSKDHMAKTAQQLTRLGYLRSVRGRQGGIELARSPETISLGRVITDFEGRLNLLECVAVENVCVIQPRCKLKQVLAEAERVQIDYLNGVRLSDVVEPGRQLVDLTPLPPGRLAATSAPAG